MPNSMTGYGTSTLQLEDTTITVEIRSVNHRFLDIIPKYPRSFLFMEEKIKNCVKKYFQRGRIEIHIEVIGNHFVNKTIAVNWELMDQFIEQLELAKNRYSLNGDIPFSSLTNIPDLISIQENEQKPTEIADKLISCVDEACSNVLAMRQDEGKYLMEDIQKRVAIIHNTVMLLSERRETVIKEYQLRIKKRIESLTNELISLDDGRIYQEIAILAEKGDISEEITRLLSHLDQISELLKSKDPIGRKLDFIVQEMNREANTIGSKSTDSKIGEWTVQMKSEIEKIKEQVQNME
ncbi:hypothetical protein GCM10008025_29090 [Ornithinibacillus halotolerans]|uniref:YicC family protein n=1 Tax=Ornithinibacillus halotolerans TaxID=1274357 RepID=A0A916S795_9BACI|nr:hypothetical protein GCM10008025_29090 [Ornithinibacillus halotolerans]